ncbi:MAG TPA: Uma2 family endonuclease, partial [Polyangiaceae bacterium]|nr:Uma2 family endonuclease [Polyangiaceae bacterium]
PRIRVSAAEYLAGELSSAVKHEYLGGVVYAMAGGRNAHNLIASNFVGVLHGRLQGGPCRAYNSDTKIRVQLPTELRFYYPDASVICRPNPQTDTFQDQPAVVAEVVSSKTRRIDEGEKKQAYLTLPSLSAYLLIEQELASVTVYRRSEAGFQREVYSGLDATIPLPEIGTALALADLYDGVEWIPEPDDDL